MLDPDLSRWLHSRLAGESDEYAEAYVDANFWASTIFRGLESTGQVRTHLQEFRARCGDEEWEAFFRDDPGDPRPVRERLYYRIDPGSDGDREASDTFWDEFLTVALEFEPGQTGAWYRGFAEGCLEYWEVWEGRGPAPGASSDGRRLSTPRARLSHIPEGDEEEPGTVARPEEARQSRKVSCRRLEASAG